MEQKIPPIYLVFQRNMLYMRRANGIKKLFFIMLLMSLSIILIFSFVKLKYTPPVYIQTGIGGKKFTQVPFNQPYLNDQEIIDMATLTVEYLNSYNYSNYHDYLPNLFLYVPITKKALTRYLIGLKESLNLRRLTHSHMGLSAIIGDATIVKKGVMAKYFGAYIWIVDVPATILWFGDVQLAFKQDTIWRIYIARFPISGQSPRGVKVFQITTKEKVSNE